MAGPLPRAVRRLAPAPAGLDEAASLASRYRDGCEHLHAAVVRDMLAAGVNWWRPGDLMSMDPQAAYERFGRYGEGVKAPAEQHPQLAVLVGDRGQALGERCRSLAAEVFGVVHGISVGHPRSSSRSSCSKTT
jgi:hypothetical protein